MTGLGGTEWNRKKIRYPLSDMDQPTSWKAAAERLAIASSTKLILNIHRAELGVLAAGSPGYRSALLARVSHIMPALNLALNADFEKKH